jgi:Zn-dependent membrane protease YugP
VDDVMQVLDDSTKDSVRDKVDAAAIAAVEAGHAVQVRQPPVVMSIAGHAVQVRQPPIVMSMLAMLCR